MSGYQRKLTFKGTFDGDQVEVDLRPLEFGDLLTVRSARQASPGDDEITARTLIELYPKYILEVRGLTSADGTAVTKEELVGSSYFGALSMTVASFLVSKASVQNPEQPAS